MTDRPFADMLASAKPAERTIAICLRADLVADFEVAERDLEVAIEKGSTSLAGSGAAELAERIEALQTEMRDSTVDFRLRAMPRGKFRALIGAHEPRRDAEDNVVEDDRLSGVNSETFYPALIRASTVAPEPTDAEWQQLLDETLSDAQYEELFTVAWQLNRSPIDVPFSRAASRYRRATADE